MNQIQYDSINTKDFCTCTVSLNWILSIQFDDFNQLDSSNKIPHSNWTNESHCNLLSPQNLLATVLFSWYNTCSYQQDLNLNKREPWTRLLLQGQTNYIYNSIWRDNGLAFICPFPHTFIKILAIPLLGHTKIMLLQSKQTQAPNNQK